MSTPSDRRVSGGPRLASARATGLVPGRKLARYQLLCEVGQGGMASIWAARRQGQTGPDNLVALKTIRPDYAHDARFRTMFMDEGRIASRIEHTNVARILDLGEEGDLLYLVMEWVNGDSLSQLRRRVEERGQQIPLGILLRILADLCGGLHAAHELCDPAGASLSVVHRDVSPENILVDTQGVVKLIDFGVAKARDRSAEETKSGILKGKLAYMAPEQALKGQADRRADVWATGALLYKFLSGRAPFQGESHVATLCLIVAGHDPPRLPASIDRSVAAVVQRALRHNPKDRFATAAELQSALLAAMVDARVPTTIEDVAKFVSLHMADRIAVRREVVAEAARVVSEAERNPEQAAMLGRSCIRMLGAPHLEPMFSEAEREADTQVAGPPTGMTGPLGFPWVRSFATRLRVLGAVGALALAAGGLFLGRAHLKGSSTVVSGSAPVATSVAPVATSGAPEIAAGAAALVEPPHDPYPTYSFPFPAVPEVIDAPGAALSVLAPAVRAKPGSSRTHHKRGSLRSRPMHAAPVPISSAISVTAAPAASTASNPPDRTIVGNVD